MVNAGRMLYDVFDVFNFILTKFRKRCDWLQVMRAKSEGTCVCVWQLVRWRREFPGNDATHIFSHLRFRFFPANSKLKWNGFKVHWRKWYSLDMRYEWMFDRCKLYYPIRLNGISDFHCARLYFGSADFAELKTKQKVPRRGQHIHVCMCVGVELTCDSPNSW